MQTVHKNNKFPRAWITGMLLPLHKKRPKSCVGNYRGIMLLSCLGKLFSAIINESLLNFLHQNNILAKEQIGFMRGNRTSDNLIIIHDLIHQNFKKSKKLYACFIDFEKAFDSVPRHLAVAAGETEKLWCKRRYAKNYTKYVSRGQSMYKIFSLAKLGKYCEKSLLTLN